VRHVRNVRSGNARNPRPIENKRRIGQLVTSNHKVSNGGRRAFIVVNRGQSQKEDGVQQIDRTGGRDRTGWTIQPLPIGCTHRVIPDPCSSVQYIAATMNVWCGGRCWESRHHNRLRIRAIGKLVAHLVPSVCRGGAEEGCFGSGFLGGSFLSGPGGC
jgi:hypothetical protein